MQLHRRGLDTPSLEHDAYGQNLTGGAVPQGQAATPHQDTVPLYPPLPGSTTMRRQVSCQHRSSNSFSGVSGAGSDSSSIRSSHKQKRTPNGKPPPPTLTDQPTFLVAPTASCSSYPLDGVQQEPELWATLPADGPGGSITSRGGRDNSGFGDATQWQSPSHRKSGPQVVSKKPAAVPQSLTSFDGGFGTTSDPSPPGRWSDLHSSDGFSAFGGTSTTTPMPAQQQPPPQQQSDMFLPGNSFLPANEAVNSDAIKPQVSGGWMSIFLSMLSRTTLNEGAHGGAGNPLPIYQTRFGDPEDDLPLWVELGINTSVMRAKSIAVLNPFHPPAEDVASNNDLAGPIVFAVTMASLLLLQGKVEFTAVYVLLVLGALGFRILLSLLSGSSTSLTFIVSTLGYGLLPSLFLSVVTAAHFWVLGVRMTSTVIPFTIMAIGWSSWSAAALMTVRMHLKEQRFLILYPVALFYTVFAALVVL